MPLITIDETKCKKDGICVAECPLAIIERAGKDAYPRPTYDAEELCIKCGHCVAVCPHAALAHREFGPEECTPLRKELSISGEQAGQFLIGRRSVRTYREKPVERELLEKLIATARYAPTGHNSQSIRWMVFQDRQELARLSGMVIDWLRYMMKAMPSVLANLHPERVVKRHEEGVDIICRGAPHVILAYGSKTDPNARTSCVIALTHLELAVPASGLGACWAGYFNAAATYWPPLIKEINLPENHEPYGSMMIGYPKYAYHRIPKRNEPVIEWR
jgi:nitroreductase/NAD-dependent dihydropyrimidine dehydrogenase PreA subunit